MGGFLDGPLDDPMADVMTARLLRAGLWYLKPFLLVVKCQWPDVFPWWM